jgi:hypothetical protein
MPLMRTKVAFVMCFLCISSFFLASYWSAGVERFCQPQDLVSHWLGGFANRTQTLGEMTNASRKPISFYHQTIILHLFFVTADKKATKRY